MHRAPADHGLRRDRRRQPDRQLDPTGRPARAGRPDPPVRIGAARRGAGRRREAGHPGRPGGPGRRPHPLGHHHRADADRAGGQQRAGPAAGPAGQRLQQHRLPNDYGTNFPTPTDPLGFGYANQTAIGWEGNYLRAVRVPVGLVLRPRRAETYTAGQAQSYCGAMYSFGAYT